MKPTLIMGIDPGFTGAIAIYDPTAFRIVHIRDMPLKAPSQLFPNEKDRRQIDPEALAGHILAYAPKCLMCVLEKVSAAPKQGVTSMFRFGEGFGMIQGILACHGLKTMKTPPAVWKSALNLTSDKSTAFRKCQRAFNYETNQKYFPKQKDHGRAEAILLAMFGAKSLGFSLPGDFGGDKSHELF